MTAYLNYELGQFQKLLQIHERGAVIADPMFGHVRGGQTHVRERRNIDRFSLLTSLLFVDRYEYLDLQTPPVQVGPPRNQGPILGERGKIQLRTANPAGEVDFQDLSLAAWLGHEALEPSAWTIWHDDSFDPIAEHRRQPNLGFKLKLQSMLVLPHESTDPEQIIAFRDANRDALRDLRHHLARLCIKVAESGPNPELVLVEAEDTKAAIEAVVERALKANWRRVIGDLEIRANWAEAALAAAKGAWHAGIAATLTTGGDLLGALKAAAVGAVSGITVESTYGVKGAGPEPYAYLAKAVKELN